MALNYNKLHLAIIKTIRDTSAVSALVGSRVHTRVPKTVQFPFIAAKNVPTGVEASTFKATDGGKVTRVWNVDFDFECLTHETSSATCGLIQAALATVFEKESNFDTEFTAISVSLLAITPVVAALEWSPENGTWSGLASFTLMVQE